MRTKVMSMLKDELLPNFLIQEQLYEGKHTNIYKAFQVKDQKPIIIKTFKYTHPSPALINKLKREYNILKKINSSHVVKPLDFIQVGGRMVLVYEDQPYEPLHSIIEK